EWFVVQEPAGGAREAGPNAPQRRRSRRLVHRTALDARDRFDGCAVVATRFVRACPKGHVDDIDWYRFVHGTGDSCRNQLWLDEHGTGGDLSDLAVRCTCGKRRGLHEAKEFENRPLETCNGARPWLGRHAGEDCVLPARLLIRTASNAWFAQVVSMLSLPDRTSGVDQAVAALWDDLQIVDGTAALAIIKRKPSVAERLAPFDDAEVLEAVDRHRTGGGGEERPVKQVELDALLAVPEGFGEDVPVDPDFHARRLPDTAWRRTSHSNAAGIESVVQVHRLREVSALAGFTRFEAVTPDIDGEYDSDVERADIALEPSWFPAVENRGEGIFLQLRAAAVEQWLARPEVSARVNALAAGHARWNAKRQERSRRAQQRPFPGGPYVLLHTLSHLLIQSLAVRCGYPAASIRERVYVDGAARRYGLLLYTASADAEGTLGGLVQEARRVEAHLEQALAAAGLCSNDPICAQHEPGGSMEERWLHGAACHGCALVAETSCEMRNDYLDRALVVPVIGVTGASFFETAG
ncbi:MAG: DUF1998 domain-containing protein, partial [Acidobacteria bacterium]|nr:DUF1998 domain-containing protein [Acidobacteriota bacterium]